MQPGETFIDRETFPTAHLIEAAQEINVCKGCCYNGNCHTPRECKDVIFKDKGPIEEPMEKHMHIDEQVAQPGVDITTASMEQHCHILRNEMNLRFLKGLDGKKMLQQGSRCIECGKVFWNNVPLVDESSTRDQD